MLGLRLHIINVLIFILGTFPNSGYGTNLDDDIDIILDRLVHKSNASVDYELNLYDSIGGSFIDIDYTDSSYVYWQPIRHLERINHITEAYINSKHQYYKSPKLHNVIIKCLEFWHQREPTCKNWWFNQVLVPQQIGLIVINMRYSGVLGIPPNLEKGLIDIMKKCVDSPEMYTGANRIDIAIHWIYRGCLTKDSILLQYVKDILFEPLDYSNTEGISIDNCFLQHGKQLYIGGYGLRFLDSMTQIAYLFIGTKYSISSDKLNNLCDFARNTFFRSIRGRSFSFNAIGRNLSRKGALKESSRLIQIAQRLIKLDPLHQKEYEFAIKQIKGELTSSLNTKVLHSHYYCSDYTLHTSPLYTFDVRFSSKSTQLCETLNNENLKGYFLSYGSNCLMTTGDEYDGIFPVWDWARIPGVTAPQITEIPIVKHGALGQSEIAGGVSDSLCGVTAFVLNDSCLQVYAKKSWFFFDREIVCLGSDIHSNSDKQIETSINQCLCPSGMSMIYSKESIRRKVVDEVDTVLCNPEWLLFNHIGYVFPDNQSVIISKKEQIGNWRQINNAYDNSIIKRNVFYLGINHNYRPRKAYYSYTIVPGIDSEGELLSYLMKTDIRILQHSSLLHAVYNQSEDMLQIVFFEKGEFQEECVSVSVNNPSLIIIKGAFTKKHPILHVASLIRGIKQMKIHLSTKNINKHFSVIAEKTGLDIGKSVKLN